MLKQLFSKNQVGKVKVSILKHRQSPVSSSCFFEIEFSDKGLYRKWVLEETKRRQDEKYRGVVALSFGNFRISRV